MKEETIENWSVKSRLVSDVQGNQPLDPQQVIEEFKLVLALEEKMAQLYLQLADDCEDIEARRMLLELSRQEQAHARIARRLVRLVSGWYSRHQ